MNTELTFSPDEVVEDYPLYSVKDPVLWSKWGEAGRCASGTMSKDEAAEALAALKQTAENVRTETKAFCVLYGMAHFSEEGTLKEVNFFMEPLTQAEYEQKTRLLKNAQIYTVPAQSLPALA